MLETIKQHDPSLKKISQSMHVTMSSTAKTIPLKNKITDQIKDKMKTFAKWNLREEVKSHHSKRKYDKISRTNSDSIQVLNAIMGFAKHIEEKDHKKNQTLVMQQLPGVKAERRQRFKKVQNPLIIIKTYMQKDNFNPSPQIMALMNKIINNRNKIQKNSKFSIQILLQSLYKVMNVAVDYNELHFFCLIILLISDICLENKDLKRALYFYNQARVAATYAQLPRLKIDALLGMGKIALQQRLIPQAIIIFKKALQFAWKIHSQDFQLLIYDYIGKCYYYDGVAKSAQYFHTRYMQGQVQSQQSAIKKIASEMLTQYDKVVKSLQKTNLTSLFIEYLNLPIAGFYKYPPCKPLKQDKYANYDDSGQSPRRKKKIRNFQFDQFPEVKQFLLDTLTKDIQFKFQIPLPDVHRNFVSQHAYGKPRKDVDYTQTAQYHKLVGIKPPKMKFEELYKYPLQVRIQKRLKEKTRQNWWEQIVANTKKQKSQKLGRLKNVVLRSHESYFKYPQQRRKSQSLRVQKIKQSFNRTLLDFIDPIK